MKIGPYKWNGKVVTRKQFLRKKVKGAAGVPRIARGASQSRPLRSIGLGVHPSQVDEFNAFYAGAGITGAFHDRDGTCVLESRQARNRVLQLRNMRDNDAGYGDHAGYH